MKKDQLERLLALFHFDCPNRTMLLSFLEGDTVGRAFVDNEETPKACVVVIGFQNWTFIGGQPRQEWLDELFDQLRNEVSLTLVWAPWMNLEVIPPPHIYKRTPRYEFIQRFTSPQGPEDNTALTEGCYFKNMNEELMSDCLFGDEMGKAYGSKDNFLRHGLGICLMHKDEIYCEVYAAFRAENGYELGIATHEMHRRKGYAFVTSAYLIKLCEEKGYQISWSCDQNNYGSVATARKLNYTKPREYALLYFARHS